MKYRNYSEYLKHPMFKIARLTALVLAGGRCEVCSRAEASEVHHRDSKYPPWGSFDTPANLMAVCHQCHCDIHGKEN